MCHLHARRTRSYSSFVCMRHNEWQRKGSARETKGAREKRVDARGVRGWLQCVSSRVVAWESEL